MKRAVDITNFFMIMLVLLICRIPTKVKSQGGSLPEDEVEALKEIARQLGKKDWDFSVDPCIGDSSWRTPIEIEPSKSTFSNNLTCNCSDLNGICHVVDITLREQDLDGVLPSAIVKLPYLKKLDLTRNYLSGNIPPEWVSSKLEYISVTVNRLTGPIPPYLANMTSLKHLSLVNNMFNGTVPPELGNLVNLEGLLLSANNLTGELPFSLSKMTKLEEFRISGNNFTGKIPTFITSWKYLQELEMEGSGLQGPIPSSISLLSNLTQLRISNVYGEGSEMPNLNNTRNVTHLVIRNCNISGSFPGYILQLPSLKLLDLSFNRLTGNLPSNVEGIAENLEYMFLTSNLLTGPVPDWMETRPVRAMDISYNNFNRSYFPSTCRESLNLFRSSSGENTEAVECLQNYACSKEINSLHINCGGPSIAIGDINYEEDEQPGGPAKYVPTKEHWQVSTSGNFWDVNKFVLDEYIATNVVLNMSNPGLYTKARLSPLSLTYNVRCLANGNYNVRLHFAEIKIRNNRSFYSLGRRMFDVYIQDKRELKDFNIKEKAGAADKEFIQKFKAVVKDGTLSINFRWVGKGTTVAPRKGTYGPLISAIDVESDFRSPMEKKRMEFAIGGSIALIFLIFIIVGILWWRGCLGRKAPKGHELVGLDVQTGFFTFRQIKAATNDFNPANKIGEGGFGAVYKGILSDGTTVAVKQLSSKSKQGNREFVNEIGMISALQHPHLARLFGCCIEGSQLLLVYEYMENNSVAHALFGKNEERLNLDWPTRYRICVGIARGLAYLHEESTLKIVHRDIKTANVLLDKDMNPKISDFGLAKLYEEENSHIITRIAGTIGYMAPEYALLGHLTYKADVYSFGIVALEIVAGEHNMKSRENSKFVCLLDQALILQQKEGLIEMVDSRLQLNFDKEEVIRVIEIALLCTSPTPALRPSMSTVVSMLEGRSTVHASLTESISYEDELRYIALRKQYEEIMLQHYETQSQSRIHSSHSAHFNSSSTPRHDFASPSSQP